MAWVYPDPAMALPSRELSAPKAWALMAWPCSRRRLAVAGGIAAGVVVGMGSAARASGIGIDGVGLRLHDIAARARATVTRRAGVFMMPISALGERRAFRVDALVVFGVNAFVAHLELVKDAPFLSR